MSEHAELPGEHEGQPGGPPGEQPAEQLGAHARSGGGEESAEDPDERSADRSAELAEGVDADALVSRLRVIEGQPLEQRADAFGQLYDELRARLESSDARPHD